MGIPEDFSFDYLINGPQGVRKQNLTLRGNHIKMASNYQVMVEDTLTAWVDLFTAFQQGKSPLAGFEALKVYIYGNSAVSPHQ